MADKEYTLSFCNKHQEWFSNNCSNCMIDDNEADIKAAQLAHDIEAVKSKKLTEILSRYLSVIDGRISIAESNQAAEYLQSLIAGEVEK